MMIKIMEQNGEIQRDSVVFRFGRWRAKKEKEKKDEKSEVNGTRLEVFSTMECNVIVWS